MTARYKLRTEALLRGDMTFVDAKGCKRCGNQRFYTSNAACMMCLYEPRESFAEWARRHQLEGRDLTVAELAWRSAMGNTPMPLDDALAAVRSGTQPTADIARHMGVSLKYAQVVLRRLKALGFVDSETRGTYKYWRAL